MLDKLTADVFRPVLNEHFQVFVQGYDPIVMELIEVNDRSQFTSGKMMAELGQRMPFTLLFRSAPNIYLPQSIYHIENPSVESMDIFLVPVGPDSKGMQYEAVFS